MQLLAATNNKGKLREYKRMLEPLGFEILSLSDLSLQADPEETGSSFAENARIKAGYVCALSGLPALADDSGLCVDALDGAPGIYSARYSGGSDEDNNQKLLQELKDVPMEKRTARFVCAICCAWPDGSFTETEGVCEGKIDFAPVGEEGFGYDPLFLSDEVGSFGLASPEEKDAVSHRGAALRELVARLKEENRV
ncbi:MAG: RdgB/HAM1 family non-canonical purine NTP pyrophosphatase [Oscillospiraceae bacterium]|nr:RdgB/HAM1 family non-canonical purine NTP pyrophosphatase [Oscillospiraceae bacterium]